MELKDKVTCIKGIGEKTAGNLAKLGISTVSDLIHYYPRTYITYMDPVDIQDIQADERQAVSVTINSRVEVKKLRGFSIATAYAKDYTGTIKLTWFNCPFLRNYFHIGSSSAALRSSAASRASANPRFCCSFAARSAKPKTCSMSRARNRCGRSNSALCV